MWYAVLSSKELPMNKVVAVRRFSEDLVFFRNAEGKAGCVTSLCAHRGASLAKGCVCNGNVQCPFHGIEYDVTGKCVFVPSDGRASTADLSRFNLKHYAVFEAGDIIFVWYGEGEPEGEPDYFDVITDDSFSYDQVNDGWKVHYSRVIENQLDVSHLPFVHGTTIGRGNKTLCNGPKVVWLNDNTLQTSTTTKSSTTNRFQSIGQGYRCKTIIITINDNKNFLSSTNIIQIQSGAFFNIFKIRRTLN